MAASVFGDGLILPKANETTTKTDANAAAPQPAYFDALLQRGKKRQTEESITAFGELPQLQLGLQDISRKVRNLGHGGPSAGLVRGADARAHYLLSASGVNTGQALRDIDDLTASAGGAGAGQDARARVEPKRDVAACRVRLDAFGDKRVEREGLVERAGHERLEDVRVQPLRRRAGA